MNSNYLPTSYQQFIHLSRYSRFLWDKGRRETWPETVARYFDFFEEHIEENHGVKKLNGARENLEEAVLGLHVMPSMRALMTAGEALKRENVAGYNCSYIAVDRPSAFDEILYILMNGTGVGFSVERQYVSQLPVVAEEFHKTDVVINVADSKIGWAKALKQLIALLYQGLIPEWDMSKVRPAGSPLKTFGGRASGPEPLEDLFRFIIATFQKAAGRKLNSLEAHDLVCKIADIVVVGGVRRSALISLSNLSDDRMRGAKSGQWWEINPQRRLANNSACYTEKPEVETYLAEMLSLIRSKSGERGIFNRESAQWQASRNGRRDAEQDFGTNPCSEIILRSRQFCNLSEVVVRPGDNKEDLLEKVTLATVIGTLQCTLTNFKYLSKKWKENCEEERLLGVSLTGIMDNAFTNGTAFHSTDEHRRFLEDLRDKAIEVNKYWADLLGIPASVAITCGKPSGTVSQLVNAASGIHARHGLYYIRTVRQDMKDPLSMFMIDNGFPAEPDMFAKTSTWVFSFPMKSPDNAIFRKDWNAIEQLELWKTYQIAWAEHKPSVTISVKETEWPTVIAWVHENWKYMSGVSFLPFDDHIYPQAPYQDCTKEEYEELLASMPKNVDWSKLSMYENEDMTTGAQELACVAGGCEI